VQTERDHHIAQLTDELALKSALLEQAEANVVEAARRAGPELPEALPVDAMPTSTVLIMRKYNIPCEQALFFRRGTDANRQFFFCSDSPKEERARSPSA
jgi:hypothetical protein